MLSLVVSSGVPGPDDVPQMGHGAFVEVQGRFGAPSGPTLGTRMCGMRRLVSQDGLKRAKSMKDGCTGRVLCLAAGHLACSK